MRSVLYPVVGIATLLACFDHETVVPSVPTASIEGVVTDGTTGRPLSHAVVRIDGAGIHGALTDRSGYFSLPELPDGRYTLTVVLLGYVPPERQVMVEPERTAVADFALEVTSINLDEIVVTGVGTLYRCPIRPRAGEVEKPFPGS